MILAKLKGLSFEMILVKLKGLSFEIKLKWSSFFSFGGASYAEEWHHEAIQHVSWWKACSTNL